MMKLTAIVVLVVYIQLAAAAGRGLGWRKKGVTGSDVDCSGGDTTGDVCQTSCKDLTNGDYQSCVNCHTFIKCSNHIMSVMDCPPGLVFDNSTGNCEYTSETCTACTPGVCTDGFHKINDKCYQMRKTGMTWLNSMDDCYQLGGQLADLWEDDDFEAVIAQVNANEGSGLRYWVGSRKTNTKNFYWVNDQPQKSFKLGQWNSGEPNNKGGDENCVEKLNTRLNDLACHYAQAHLCQKLPEH